MSTDREVWVYVDVVCDLFHAGHVEFFRKARALGDRLIVGLVSDEDAMTYKPAPIMTFAERHAVVSQCRLVDRVLDYPCPLFATQAHLDGIGADFAAHGDDMGTEEIAKWYADLLPSGRIRMVSYTQSISSRAIVERIANRLKDGSLRIKL